MSRHCLAVIGVSAGWMLTAAIMVDATVDRDLIAALWAVILAFGASVPTYYLILEWLHARTRELVLDALKAERTRNDLLIQAVAREFATRELAHLESRRNSV